MLQAASGATGTKTATAAGDADSGNAHILALRPATPGLTIAKPAGTVANDVMVAAVGIKPNTAAITAPAGWTLVRRIDHTGAGLSLAVYRKLAGGAEPAAYTWAVSGFSDAVGGIQSFSGVDTANPIEVEAGQCTPQPTCDGTPLTHPTPSVTTTVANTMLVTAHTFESSATWTPPAGMTEAYDVASLPVPNAAGQSIEGNYQLQAAPGATGAKTATASNNGDEGVTHILALRPVVNTAPTVSLTSPANGAIFTAPASIVLTANAQDSDGTVAQVEFFQGATLVATDTIAPFTFTLTNVAAGSYTFTAKATDNLGASTTSAAVSVTVNAAAQMFFIHTDHLNTPRLITNGAGQAVWRWDQTDPFGGNVPDENPSGLGTFTCNLRLPGQYFDQETNLHYNYWRDYDSAIGRYIQADPLGLPGGFNLYAYVEGDPIALIDPLGLLAIGPRPAPRYTNGNYVPGFTTQRPGCDGFPNYFENPCVKQCCAIHDQCYKNNGCNVSSWVGNRFGYSLPCQQCNAAATRCVQSGIASCNACGPTTGAR